MFPKYSEIEKSSLYKMIRESKISTMKIEFKRYWKI